MARWDSRQTVPNVRLNGRATLAIHLKRGQEELQASGALAGGLGASGRFKEAIALLRSFTESDLASAPEWLE